MWAFSIRGNLLHTKTHYSCFILWEVTAYFNKTKKTLIYILWRLPHNTKMKPSRKVSPTSLEGRERETSVSLLIKAKCAVRGERELSVVARKVFACGKLAAGSKYQAQQEPWIIVTLFSSRLIIQLMFTQMLELLWLDHFDSISSIMLVTGLWNNPPIGMVVERVPPFVEAMSSDRSRAPPSWGEDGLG